MRGVRVLAAAAAAALLAGCTAGPERIAGAPAPAPAGSAGPTPAPGSPGTSAPGPSAGPATPAGTPTTPPTTPPTSSPASTATPAPTPGLPAGYEPLWVAGSGVTVRFAAPEGWTRTRTAAGWDMGDPSGQLLLRVEVRPRSGETAAALWKENEDLTRRRLAGYRLLATTAVAGVGDDALDWTFTFERDGVRRQVVDRLIVRGAAGVAVYFSAPEQYYPATLPVWERAVAGLQLS